jgi:hypothetical protein
MTIKDFVFKALNEAVLEFEIQIEKIHDENKQTKALCYETFCNLLLCTASYRFLCGMVVVEVEGK